MNNDQVKGVAKRISGTTKDVAGAATGNTSTQAEGKVEKVAGKIQQGFGNAKEKLKGQLK